METLTADRRPTEAQPVPSTQPTLVLTLTEVAAHLRCARRSIERQVSGGHLHVVHIGRAVRVERREIDRYLDSLRDLDDAG